MILFLAYYPEPGREADGYVQRLLGMDRLFDEATGEDRVYVRFVSEADRDPAPRLRQVSERIRAYTLRCENGEDQSLVMGLLSEARLIYAHSIFGVYDFLRYFELPFIRAKLVLDAHGVVPEEEAFQGKVESARFLDEMEGLAVPAARVLVTVSGAMTRHFRAKYPRARFESVELPMFQAPAAPSAASVAAPIPSPTPARPRVVYAGGVHPWQNVDLMVASCADVLKSADISFLTPEPTVLRQKLEAAGVPVDGAQVLVQAVPRAEVAQHYARARYGWVLRDDSLVNRVACPTKLIEYLDAGLIPVVKSPALGDFEEMGYFWVSNDDLRAGRLPDESHVQAILAANLKVVKTLRARVESGRLKLQKLDFSRELPPVSRQRSLLDRHVAPNLRNRLKGKLRTLLKAR